MRRIEQDEIERIIGKRHLAEVPDDIGPDLQSAPIAKGMFSLRQSMKTVSGLSLSNQHIRLPQQASKIFSYE